MFTALAKGYQQVTSATATPPQSAEGTIDKLVDRLLNGQRLEDRRAALLGLKGLSRDWKQEVGSRALPVLIGVLEEDANDDTEIAKAVVETLSILCEIELVDGRPVRDDSGLRNTDIFLTTATPLHTLLELLTSPHFYLKYFALQLIGILLNNRPQQVQSHVLTSPGGVGRLVETLNDSREIIRNEALLLLIGLTTSNADIQKLLAFEGSFDKLFAIIKAEGGVGSGGIVVQDCLAAIGGLLRWNVSNQNYFRETSCIPLLVPLLHFPQPSAITPASLTAFAFQTWSEQKVINAGLVISLVRMLVGGAGSGRSGNQKALLATGMTRCLSELALASNAPAVLKAQALNALSDILRGSEQNQTFFASLELTPLIPPSAPSHEATYTTDPEEQPEEHRWKKGRTELALTALARLAVLGDGTPGRDGLSVRAGACASFENFVIGSSKAQMLVLKSMVSSDQESGAATNGQMNDSQTLQPRDPQRPNGNDESESQKGETAGTIVLDALRTFPAVQTGRPFDSYESFFASLIFSHLIEGNAEAKAFARDMLGSSSGAPDRSMDEDEPTLVNQLVGNLMMAQREQAQSANAGASPATVFGWTRVMCGYLMVLSLWLWESPPSVKDFLSEGSNVQVLIQPITQSSGVDSLVQGLCAFLLGIVYEYNREPGDITRETLHPILQTRVGPDQFVSRILRLREDPRFRTVGPDVFEMNEDEDVLDDVGDDGDGLWFDYSFVEFLKTNYIAVQRAILLEPNAAEAGRKSIDGVDSELLISLRSTIDLQGRDLEKMKQQVSNMERERAEEREAYRNEVSSLTEQLVALQAELAQLREEKTDGEREQEDLLVLLEEMSLKRKGEKAKLREAGYEVSDDEDEDEPQEDPSKGVDDAAHELSGDQPYYGHSAPQPAVESGYEHNASQVEQPNRQPHDPQPNRQSYEQPSRQSYEYAQRQSYERAHRQSYEQAPRQSHEQTNRQSYEQTNHHSAPAEYDAHAHEYGHRGYNPLDTQPAQQDLHHQYANQADEYYSQTPHDDYAPAGGEHEGYDQYSYPQQHYSYHQHAPPAHGQQQYAEYPNHQTGYQADTDPRSSRGFV